MSFYKRYELERLIADGEAKTFRAIENATGRTVFLHLFNPGGQALLADLKAKLAGPGGKAVAPLLEIGEFAGSPYAVTEGSEPFTGLREWLNRQPEAVFAPSPAPPKPAPRPPAPPVAAQPPRLLDEEPGEFTKQFPPSAPAEKPWQLSRPPVAAQPPRLLDEEPGEFTRLFPPSAPAEKPWQVSRPPVAAETPGLLDDASGEFHQTLPPARPSGTTPATPAGEEPGDFTRAFGPVSPKAPDRAKPPARVPPRPPSPLPPPPRREVQSPPSPFADRAAPADTGEFTKLFGSGLSGEAIDIAGEQAKAARTTVNENRPFQKAGEFTRIFGPETGGGASAGPPPAAPLSLNTSASGVFGSPGDLAKLVKNTSDAPKQPESQSDPGEYTRTFGEKPGQREVQRPPEASKPAAAAVPIAAQKPKMQPAAIIGVVAAVLVLVALIVVAVVLSKR